MDGGSGGAAAPTATGGGKRTRKGETFLNPSAVALHCTDFAWADLDARIRAEEAAVAAAAIGGAAPAAAPALSSAGENDTTALDAANAAAWEGHYVRNKAGFFPIKNYILRAFPTLFPPGFAPREPADGEKGSDVDGDATCDAEPHGDREAATRPPATDGAAEAPRVVLDAGCGTGSVALPLMRCGPASDRFVCFDISPSAVELLLKHRIATAHPGGVEGFACDLAAADDVAAAGALDGGRAGSALHAGETLARPVPTLPPDAALRPYAGAADRVLLVFVLCALPANRMRAALLRLRRCLRRGGAGPPAELCFRDYGRHDHAERRFLANRQPVRDGGFVKGDGTTQHFFELEEVRALFASAGLAALALEYHCNEVRNRKTGQAMHKVFVNGVFVRDESFAHPTDPSS